MRDGDCFGEIALLRGVPRTASVIAMSRLRLRSLAREDFLSTVAGPTASRTAADLVVAERLAADARPAEGPAPITDDPLTRGA